MEIAWRKQWPLLLIITHWEKEWHEDWESKQPSIAKVIRQHLHHQQYRQYSEQLANWQATRLSPIKDQDLSPMLNQALIGLSDKQQMALLNRAGGNPRYLDEIIKFCQPKARLFVERDTQQALTEKGLEQCLKKSVRLYDLVEDRLDKTHLMKSNKSCHWLVYKVNVLSLG